MSVLLLYVFHDIRHISLNDWEVILSWQLTLVIEIVQSLLIKHLLCKLYHRCRQSTLILNKGLQCLLVDAKFVDKLSWQLPSLGKLMIVGVKLELIGFVLNLRKEIVETLKVHGVYVLLLVYSFSDNRLVGKAY